MRIRPCRLYRRLYRSQCSTRCARPDSPPTANGFDPLHGRGGWKRPLPALRGNANGRPEHRPRKTESDHVNLGTFFSRLRGRTHPPPPARPHPGKPNRTTLNTRKPDMTPQLIRICLNENGTVHYFPWYQRTEDYGGELEPGNALDLLRAGTPAELSCDAPGNPHSHFETLNQTVTFAFI